MPRLALRLRWSPLTAVLAMLTAVAFFGSNFVVSRYGAQHGFRPEDLSALRFVLVAPFILPLFVRRGVRDCAGLGWWRGILLGMTSGAPMTLFMNFGLTYAPASHGAAFGPGTVMMVGVLYGVVMARKLPPAMTIAGLLLVLGGLAAVALSGRASGSPDVVFGDTLFFLTGLLWGFYPVLLNRWRVDAMTGAAICVVVSLPWAVPYLLFADTGLFKVSLGALAFQTAFQTTNFLGGLWLWGNAVRVLGPAKTALFPPMIPVIGTLVAIPILGEVPPVLQAWGIALIVVGVLLANLGVWRAIRAARDPDLA